MDSIHFPTLFRQLLPSFFHANAGGYRITVIDALTKPLQQIYNRYIEFKGRTNSQYSVRCQRLSLLLAARQITQGIVSINDLTGKPREFDVTVTWLPNVLPIGDRDLNGETAESKANRITRDQSIVRLEQYLNDNKLVGTTYGKVVVR